jgi:WD40 repeat protein
MRVLAILLFCIALAPAARAQEQAKGWLGVELKDLTKEEADALGWESPRGAKILKLLPDGPADKGGLRPGDILVSVDGTEVDNMKGLVTAIGGKGPNTEVKLRLLREGKDKRLSLTLGHPPPVARGVAKDAPLPMLDTGGHMALIRSLAFTPDGKQLVSASEDKVIRVWDLSSGKTLRTIRGETAPGPVGKLFAMALSPDGRWVASAGFLAPGFGVRDAEVGIIRVYDFQTGSLRALLKGHGNAVVSLAFSPDGNKLISGSGDKTAIIWDLAPLLAQSPGAAPDAKTLVLSPAQRLKGHGSEVYAVGFTPDNARAVTGDLSNDVRLWRVSDGAQLVLMTGHKDKVWSLAVRGDGLIATGDNSGEIRLWDGTSGAFIRTLTRKGTSARGLAFSTDGKILISTCGHGTPCLDQAWDVETGALIARHQIDNNIIVASAVSPDGRWVATGGGDNQAIRIWDLRTGRRRPGPEGTPLLLSGAGQGVWAAAFSGDGSTIGWGNQPQYKSHQERGPLQSALTLPLTAAQPGAPRALDASAMKNFRRGVTSLNGWSLSHRKGGPYGQDAILDIREGDRVAASIERNVTNGSDHRSYTFTPDGLTVISGGSFGVITAYDRSGKTLGDFIGHEGDVWAVSVSPDGRYLVSGAADQTVRLWNVKTRELLVTLYSGADGEWVMWTPQGYYTSSPAGAALIGWQINHGVAREATYVAAAQLRKHLNRPDIVARAIQLASSDAAVKEARGAEFKLSDLLEKPVPKLRLLSPEADTVLRTGHAQVRLELQETPDPVKLIRIQVNGRQIAERQPPDGVAGIAPGVLTYDVPLSKGANKIAIAAVNDTGETVASVTVTQEGEGELDRRGTLYILAVGVDAYPQLGDNCGDGKQSCNLKFAGADAKSFADAMERRAGPLHAKTVKHVLINGAGATGAPTAANIRNELGNLSGAKANDTVLLFVAGHGFNEGPNYRFAATDAEWGETTILKPATAVPWFDFQEALTEAGGRRILFLDTCHSGNAFNPKLLSDSYEANIMVYSSARWDQLANEDPMLGGGHGLFTFALVEGLDGAARDESGAVRAERLRDFLRARVTALSSKFMNPQEPQYFRARDAENYVLARVQ